MDSITWATWVTGGATVVLAILTGITLVFLRMEERRAIDDSKEQRERALQQRYDQQRPILVPTGDVGGTPMVTSASGSAVMTTGTQLVDDQGQIKWNHRDAHVAIRNVGVGTALNVDLSLFGSPPEQGAPYDRYTADRLYLVPAGSQEQLPLRIGGTTKVGFTEICSHTLYAPPKPTSEQLYGGAQWFVLRLTMTYEDIFHRKHASIFDYSSNRSWRQVDICEDL